MYFLCIFNYFVKSGPQNTQIAIKIIIIFIKQEERLLYAAQPRYEK